MSKHIAVLVLDTPIEGIAEEFGDFGVNTKHLLSSAIASLIPRHLAHPVDIITYQIAFDHEKDPLRLANVEDTFSVLLDRLAANEIVGFVLTGSRSDAFRNDIPWIARLDSFLQSRLLTTPNLPLVGLCFGHQIIAKNLGCKVNRNSAENGWECGTTTIALNSSIFSVEKSPFKNALLLDNGKLLEHINLVEFHRDIVYCLPPTSSFKDSLVAHTTFQSIGSTNKCSIQGLITESGPLKILTFQGHPEFSTPYALRMLQLDYERNIIDKAVFERLSYKSNNLINHGPSIGEVIISFLQSHSPVAP